jgi:hypothetical protein
METIKREQTVVYAPGNSSKKPMLKIINRFLLDCNFTVGSKIEVEYANDIIVIRKKPALPASNN